MRKAKLQELRKLADRMIRDEEWVEMITIRHSDYNIGIYNGRTEREHQIQIYDTEETMRRWMEESYK